MTLSNKVTKDLQIDFPIIMAPMFLVSNAAMMKSGINAGIMATFPSLNYRKEGELDGLLKTLYNYKQIINNWNARKSEQFKEIKIN
jgi:nitronate monooxygenase